MARPPIGVPLDPWRKPAGYLPAPKQARFISEAEQAAEKLPATIKAQSLKNALLKGGAKPLELEYAGMDDFVAKNQGKPVSAADVLAHLREEGPLGKLKRVEQQVGEGGYPAEESPLTYDEQVELGLPVPRYAPNIRAPFDTSTASNSTRYHEYTVPGQTGDFTGYREVLLEDPKNRATDKGMVSGAADSETGAIDAHKADYWARYNEYPDRIAVQNIQSDSGQDYSKVKHGSDDMSALNSRLEENHRARADVLAEMNDGQPLSKERESDLHFHLDGLLEEENEIVRASQGRFLLDITPEGMHQFTGPATSSTSPFVKDGNWKNLMARHIALQSINGGGKPITIPTGKQMVDVEGFGRGTHGDGEEAAEAATAFNTDLVRRLQKIFRGLHSDGADVVEHLAHQPITPPSTHADSAFFVAVGKSQSDLRKMLSDAGGGGFSGYRKSFDAMKESNPAHHRVFETIARALHDTGRNGVEKAVRSLKGSMYDELSPEFRDAAMRVIQQHYLNKERGLLDQPPPPPPADAPGWTITPSPMAVRQALEKGLPIMSLLPLLLDQQEKK